MTNFDFLSLDPQFNTFASVAIAAERILPIDPSACVVNCRRAMEFGVKWLYSVETELHRPYENTLYTLMSTEDFRDLVQVDLLRRMTFIRQLGNDTAHEVRGVTEAQAVLCLENLFLFFDFIACCYGRDYESREFVAPTLSARCDEHLSQGGVPSPPLRGHLSQRERQGILALPLGELSAELAERAEDVDLDALIAENMALREQLTARRKKNQPNYVPKPLDLSEYKTRKLYVDVMLASTGWIENQNWINEVELKGMPNPSEVGYADYVLYGDDHRPLAVVEAKRTCVDATKGRQQAKLYADLLEKQYGRRPVIFLTNGFDTRIDDGQYPERKVANIYSKRDLEKLFNLRSGKTSLTNIVVDQNIAGRYYQEGAIRAVCDAFDGRNRRKALLVMATGSGKTRTVIALCDVLLTHGWVKNILFLADRTSLVTQAKRSFVNLLPDLSVSNLCESKKDFASHCIFSTYQTMMNCIDEAHDTEGKLYTSGHFDLVICDEAHRSIYNKYKDIFSYFDAPLVGLTATPKDEIDKNTYEIFELENGVPTYGYELAQAVKDGYLVDFVTVETTLKLMEQGIVYDDLSPEDQAEYEATFADEEGEIPDSISASAMNEKIFNADTIRQVLHTLMTNGQAVDYGEKIGKTIIFAKNHHHAERIFEVFGMEYPHLKGYAKVIDNHMTYAQSAIDEFSDPQKLPQIAISVDMLDTGIDVPEVLNLVFFKRVMSRSKFWQMIGRGTRLCPNLMDGADKEQFYIFDFCGNFEFFRMNQGKATPNAVSLQSAIFKLKTQMIFKLQDLAYQTEDLIAFRAGLVDELVGQVGQLNQENFAVRQHLRYVEKYGSAERFLSISYEDTLTIETELAPLILPDEDEPTAIRFDALMYGIELAHLMGVSNNRGKKDLLGRVRGVASVANIPEIMAKSTLINQILNTDYLERAGINEFEHIRQQLRYLMKYIPQTGHQYDTDFADDILGMEWKQSELESDDLKNYKAKAEYYIREHQDEDVIGKLRSNIPLSRDDMTALERILWSQIGTREDYEAECGEKPLGEFVREIVGLSMNAAKEAFAVYLNGSNLDSRQIYFVNQIVEYIVHNGMMKDLSVLQGAPFTDKGSVIEIFTDLTLWAGIKTAIQKINANAAA